jgi:hypothetical protein
MEKILYSNDDCWGMTYLFKQGYLKVTDNLTSVPDCWIARVCYADERGNFFLKNKKGRRLIIDINPGINLFSDDYLVSIKEEIENMNNEKRELENIYSELEKKVSTLSS